MQFAYTTLPARPNRHPSNPFRPQRQPSPSPTPSINRHADDTAPPPQPPHPGVISIASPQPAIYTDPFDHAEQQASWVDLNASRRHDLVMPHEKRQAWDDAPRYDLTYENPHYTRPIDNILWLPVNPCATLDLNETVDVFKAITSEPGAGALGQWINETSSVVAEPPETMNLPQSGTPDPESELEEELTEIPLFGTERIDLPPSIESRIESTFKERDPDRPEASDTPSLFGLTRPPTRRKSSVISMAATQVGPGGRSFSGGTMASVGSKSLRHSASRISRHSQHPVTPSTPAPPSNSIGMGLPSQPPVTPQNQQRMQSLTSTRSRVRSGSIAASRMSYDPFDHVDLGSQTPFADPNLNIVLRSTVRLVDESPDEIPPEFGGLPPVTVTTPEQDGSLPPELRPGAARLVVPETPMAGRTGRARSNSRFSVTAREALVGEVLAEEQLATTERVKKESQESAQGAPRSWVTSWLYNTLRHDE